MEIKRETSCTLQEEFFELVKNGKKTVEGRLNKEKWVLLMVGDTLKMNCKEKTITKKVCKIMKYKTLELFFDAHLNEALPGKSKEEAFKIYHDMFKGDEQNYDVLALSLE